MSGLRFHCAGNNGERPPLSPAQRQNAGRWDFDIQAEKRQRAIRVWSGGLGLCIVAIFLLVSLS